tara:strand:+ start:76 stop:420 length:345 start_codon:yes stop_codon:yes gene_type:complete
MAVALECINFIVKISSIEAKYEGGWQLFKEHLGIIDGPSGPKYYDEYLFHDGAMSGTAIDGMFDFFENLGFVENEDFCVAETLMLGHLPDWLKVDQLHESASLAGVPKTKLVGL